MSTSKKVILFFLICTSIFLGSVLLFPYLKLTDISVFNKLPKPDTDTNVFQAKYGKIDTNALLVYAEKTIKVPYKPNKSYLTTLEYGGVATDTDFVTFRTYPWDVNKISVSVELNQSLKGSRYPENGLILDYGVFIKVSNEKNQPLEELLNTATKYYFIPKNIDMSQYKTFEAEIGGRVFEVTWKDPLLNTVESRSVWDINEGNMVYFIACRMFKDSPLYEKNTCYYQK